MSTLQKYRNMTYVYPPKIQKHDVERYILRAAATNTAIFLRFDLLSFCG